MKIGIVLENAAPLRADEIERCAEIVLRGEGEDEDSEVSIVVTGDDAIRRLNRDYRNKDASTDVLAFAMREGDGPVTDLLGDVVISIDTVERAAQERSEELAYYFVEILVHGLLHLLGYDHQTDREDEEMRRRTRHYQRVFAQSFPTTELRDS